MPIYQTKHFDLLALLQSIILTLYHLAAAKCKTNWVEHSKHIVYVYCNHSFSGKIKKWIQWERSLDTPLLLTKPLKDVNQKRMFTKTNNSDFLFLLPATQAGNCLEHREYVWVWVTKANELINMKKQVKKLMRTLVNSGPISLSLTS